MAKPTPRPCIACLGWGSLVWDPRSLPVSGDWHPNGPMLPVEFARESSDQRITLVLCNEAAPVRTYWTLLAVEDLEAAVAVLADREGITRRVDTGIGRYMRGTDLPGADPAEIAIWAEARDIDGVVWTSLPYGLKDSRGVMPKVAEVLEHLQRLEGKARDAAREYIEKAPSQIDTAYRRAIASTLGWRATGP